MKTSGPLSLVTFIAIVAASWPLSVITTDREFFFHAAVLVACQVLIAALLRRLRVPSVLTTVILAGGWVGYGVWSVYQLTSAGSWAERFSEVSTRALTQANEEVAPMSISLDVRLFLIVFIGLIAMLSDLCIATGQTATGAVVPLLTPYILVAFVPRTDLSVWTFLPVAAAICLMLWVAGRVQAVQWTTTSRAEELGPRRAVPVTLPIVAGVGVLATTLIVGLVTPSISPLIPGAGAGNSLTLADPSLDLRRNLNQPTDRVVLRYDTTSGTGTYLRMATLSRFDASGFTVDTTATRSASLPDVPGLSPTELARRGADTFRSTIEIRGFSSQWLPLPYAPRQVETSTGTWWVMPDSLDMVADDPSTDPVDYTVQWVQLDPDAADLATATVGTPAEGSLVTELPDDLPARITSFAQDLVAGIPSAHGKASRIQSYLRSSDFTYSTQPQPGSGYDALERFLFEDRTGYCEQFAASFAVLARAVGLPTRVVVGFLPGNRTGDSYEVSIRQMHAWPEVFYEGLGWVRYEPTPGVAVAPDYSGEPTDSAQTPTPTRTPTTQQSSAQPTAEAEPTTQTDPTSTPEANTAIADGLRTAVIIVGSVLGVAAVMLIPSVLRSARRARRRRIAATGTAEEQATAAWAELRDSCVDLGRTWPPGTPRKVGAAWEQVLPPDAHSLVQRWVSAVEDAWYSPHPRTDSDVFTVTMSLIAAVESQASRAQRWRARVLPRSLWHKSR